MSIPPQKAGTYPAARFGEPLRTAMTVPSKIHTDICEKISPRYPAYRSNSFAAVPIPAPKARKSRRNPAVRPRGAFPAFRICSSRFFMSISPAISPAFVQIIPKRKRRWIENAFSVTVLCNGPHCLVEEGFLPRVLRLKRLPGSRLENGAAHRPGKHGGS